MFFSYELHINDKLFTERAAFADGVVHVVEGLVATWFSQPREKERKKGGGGSK